MSQRSMHPTKELGGRPPRRETSQTLLIGELTRTIKMARRVRRLLTLRLDAIETALRDPAQLREHGATLADELLSIMSALDHTVNDTAKHVVPKGAAVPEEPTTTTEDILEELTKEKKHK